MARLWFYRNWMYAGFVAGLFLLATLPLVGSGWKLAFVLVYLQLPLYMLHQLEEHAGDRFRTFVNDRVAHRANALTTTAVVVINVPLVWGAVAKAVLAHLSYTDIRAALREAMPSTVDSATVPDPSALETELEQIRQSGFAVTKGERVAGDAVDVAAPFFEANGQVRGSISVILPDLRADQTTQSALAHLLRTKASLLSRQLGHTGYP